MIASLVFFIEQIATGLYIVLGVLLFLALRWWLRANGAYRATHFELEREVARYNRSNAGTVVVLLLELVLIIIGLQQIVAPTLRGTLNLEVSLVSIAEDGDFRTPVPSPPSGGLVIDPSGVQLGEVDPASQILPTPTLTPTPVGTIVPNAPPAACTSPEATLAIPANGMVVFEPITVVGVATTENFSFYRFELKGESTSGNFAIIGVDGTQAVPVEAALGQFVPAYYQPGEYEFRLTVFDITTAVRASCTVTIYISDPIPTPTPLGTEAGS